MKRYLRKAINASNKPAPRRKSIKAANIGDVNPYEYIELSRDAYIQRWANEYEGKPSTDWDNIFDNVLEDFKLYANDEASGFIEDKFREGEYTEDDMDSEFEQFIMFHDLNDYDVR